MIVGSRQSAAASEPPTVYCLAFIRREGLRLVENLHRELVSQLIDSQVSKAAPCGHTPSLARADSVLAW